MLCKLRFSTTSSVWSNARGASQLRKEEATNHAYCSNAKLHYCLSFLTKLFTATTRGILPIVQDLEGVKNMSETLQVFSIHLQCLPQAQTDTPLLTLAFSLRCPLVRIYVRVRVRLL